MSVYDLFETTYHNLKWINDSKLFAGVIMLLLNLSSKFSSVPVSKVMEAYIKFTFSKYILVFAIVWMGTRDIFVAMPITILFLIVMELLLNEESPFCCFSEGFTSHHLALLEESEHNNDLLSKDEISKAILVLEKAQKIIKKVDTNDTNYFINMSHI